MSERRSPRFYYALAHSEMYPWAEISEEARENFDIIEAAIRADEREKVEGGLREVIRVALIALDKPSTTATDSKAS